MKFFGFLMLLITSHAYSLSWQDLWQTKNQQALIKMQEEAFEKAEGLFEDPAWAATAAYRANHYEEAAKRFGALKTEDGYYNQGNALAQLGRYHQAIKAYDQALNLNPLHEDAKYNREIINALLEKQSQDQQNSQNNQDQKDNSSSQENSQQSSQENQPGDSQEKDSQDTNSEHHSSPEDQLNLNQEPSEQKNQKENKKEQRKHQEQQNSDSSSNNQEDQDSKEQQSKAQQEEDQKKSSLAHQNENPVDLNEKEQQQAKEQWLKLIPDDPGGLLRGKFLRDYHRRRAG